MVPMSDIAARLRADLTAAMRGRDREAVTVLRSTLAAIANSEAVDAAPQAGPLVEAGPIAGAAAGAGVTEVGRRELSEDDRRDIIRAERLELSEAAATLSAAGGAEEQVRRLRSGAELLGRYL